MKNADQRASGSPRIVACIPAFNAENNIGPVILKTSKYVDKVIVCDDGSRDLTGQIATMMGATVITHSKNKGYGAAIRTLFREASRLDAEITITLDADGQHDPEDIPSIVNKMELSGSDIVIGSRFVKGAVNKASPWRARGIRLITKLVSNEENQITDAQPGIRAYNNRALKTLVLTENGMGVSTEILLKASENYLKISEVPASINYHENTPTQNSIVQGLDVILTSLKFMSINNPLLFYGLPGLVCLFIALFFGAWTLQHFAATQSIITNVALIAIGSTIIGLMFLTTAIILWVLISVMREKV